MPKHRRGHGEGGIYQRASDGKWCASVELAPTPGGKRRRKVLYGRTRREVAEKLKKLHTDVAGGAMFDDAKQTVNDILDRRIANPRLGQSTREHYEKIARLHIRPIIGKTKIEKLSTSQLQHCIDTAAQAAGLGTAAVVWTVLGGALRPLANAGRIHRHMLDLVEAPQYDAPAIAPLNVEQALTLLKHIRGARFELAIRIALSLGLRLGEVLGLHKSDLDRAAHTLLIERQIVKNRGGLRYGKTKNRQVRKVAVPDVLLVDLAAHIDADTQPDCPLMFHTAPGNPVAHDDVRVAFKAALKAAALPSKTRFHDLRHSCATFLIAQGVHPRVIQEILGHSSINITMDIYGHVLPEVSRDAADKIGGMLNPPAGGVPNEPTSGV